MKSVGVTEGIQFTYEGMTGNTLRSHRLLNYVLQKKGSVVQNEVMVRMFQAYFEQGKNPADMAVLLSTVAPIQGKISGRRRSPPS